MSPPQLAGIPNTIWGIIYIVLVAPFLLTEGAGKRVFAKVRRQLLAGWPAST